uniref:Uncharacterized protein n=1 Tax=Oryza brachyantha TaxID=4533 RepID=J3LDL5_ORYBR
MFVADEEAAAMVAAAASSCCRRHGVEVRGDTRHAAVQGEAPGDGQLQQLLRLLAPGPGAAVRPVAAAQRHWSRGPRQPMNPPKKTYTCRERCIDNIDRYHRLS